MNQAAKPAPKAAAPKKAEPGKRIRRSGEQLLADAQNVVKLLAVNKTLELGRKPLWAL